MTAQLGAATPPGNPQPHRALGDTRVTRRTSEASPQFQARMAGVIALITTTSGFTAWLAIFGVNAERWKEQAV